MRTEVHQGPLEPLLEDWERLHAGQPDATPFTSPAWAVAWWPHFAADAQPFVVLACEHGRTVGLAALVRRRRGPFRILEPVGSEPGDYWDVLAEPGRRGDVAAAVIDELRRRSSGWDAWLVPCLSPGSRVAEALDAGALRHGVASPLVAPAIALPETFDAYLAGLSSGHRQNLRRHLRRLDDGEVRLRAVCEPAALEAAMARWQQLRDRQWEAAGRELDALQRTQRFQAFMRDCVRALAPRGTALVWELLHHDEVIGVYVNFADDASFHWYLGGFDPAHARLGLGKIAIGHGIRTSIAAGRRRYDFGRGAEAYKYWFGAVDRPLEPRVVGTGRVRSRATLRALDARRRRHA